MKVSVWGSIVLVAGLAIFARPGDTYNCNGGHWVVRDEVAMCVAGSSGTVPPVPLPTAKYTAEPLMPSCRPVERQTPTETAVAEHQLHLPLVAAGE